MKKILSVLLCFFLLFSATSCALISKTFEKKETPQITKSSETHEEPQEINGTYDEIIDQYTALLTAKHNGEVLPAPNTEGMDKREIAIAETLYGIVNIRKDAEAVENLGYGYKDLDSNGISELILLTKYTSIQAIFTISNGKPILLEANYDEESSFIFATKNRFFMSRKAVTDHIEEYTYYTCRVNGNKMTYDAIYGQVFDRKEEKILEYFQMINGERTLIDKEGFNELHYEQKQSTIVAYGYVCKLMAPRIHLPLVSTNSDKDQPVADFSNYAAIRETYKAIVSYADDFYYFAWIKGEYDNLFSFPSDVSFEYYNCLLYLAFQSNPDVGYDEIDLNNDGQDELVLLNGNYSIISIFTQKNGVPVLLDAFPFAICWLDNQGFIHADYNRVYELEYNLYEFTESGDYNLIYSIFMAGNGNRYLTENGKTEKITFERSLELYYDDYCRYSEPFEPYEQTRNVSALTFTPLFPSNEDVISIAVDQTWHKYADMKKTSGKDLACSNTYLSFENTTDTQMTISLKYVFTFSYPDPDRDNYLLSDSTESSLKITARNENGMFVFEENGIKGKLEFGQNHLWLIIDESNDPRFPVGHHCYTNYTSQDIIS